ncbi:hypothetical protein OPIT5_15265 [Opitutaceae bacterium TAV5]|nr:hypothetical protein OPIT5_15265 [Opitutaceae bacterium TAV5]
MSKKMNLKRSLLGSTLAAAVLGFVTVSVTNLQAQTRPSDRANPPSQNYPSLPSTDIVGAAPAQSAQSAPVHTEAPVPAPEPARVAPAAAAAPQTAAPATAGSQFRSNLYTVDKTLVSSTQVGGEYQYRLRVTALENITNISVVEHLPEGLQLVGTEPEARVSGNDLRWNWDAQSKGEVRDLLVTVRPQTEGNFVTSSSVCVDPVVVLPLFAGSPKLEIVKTGPATAELGDDVPFRITVRNTGTAIAHQVVVTDTLPDGLTSSSNLTTEVGDLPPGQSRDITVVAKASKGGELTNVASATFAEGQPVQARSVLNIVESRLGITKTGTPRTYIFKNATYQVVVRNEGNTTISNVTVTDDLPKGTSVVQTDPATEARGGRLTWTIPSLAAGQAQSYTVVLTNINPGDTVNGATATGSAITGKTLTARAEARTEWEGAPGVRTEIIDTVDPVRVGQTTTYEIQITNQGTFKPVNGQIKVTLSEQLRPISTGGDAQGTIDGQTVTFPDVLLDPRRGTKLRIEAQGVNPGSGRARLEFMSSFLDEPVIKDESTFVY